MVIPNGYLKFQAEIMVRLETTCIECSSSNIIYDKSRAEIYCGDCGLVLAEFNSTSSHNLFLDYDFSDYKEAVEYLKL